jgi:hypothetical protein
MIDETMQLVGGRGYETADSLRARGERGYPVERLLRDCRINKIFEGSSEIMRLFIAREALDPHLKRAGDAVDSRKPLGKRLASAVKAGLHYAHWLPSRYLPFTGVSTTGLEPRLAKHVRWAARCSRRLSRRLFVQMLKHGPKLEREQMLLGRFVDVATELFAISAVCAYAQHRIDGGAERAEILPLADLFCRESQIRIRGHFDGVRHNEDRESYKLAQRVLEGEYAWLEKDLVPADY